ncbi:MAG: hypothetical protein ABII12_00505 [Planctomycetota bacterium]
MDLVCIRCGEPWDMDYVRHEEPEAFKRRGGRIDHCPCCPEKKPKHSAKEQERLDAIAALADLLGDDIDGLAGTLDDFGLL